MKTNEVIKEKEIKITDLPNDIQDLYLNSTHEYKEIIKNIFTSKIGEEVKDLNRPIPPYAKGSLTKPFMQGGMPRQKKPRLLVKAIMSGNYRFVEVEGGVRGGKDIWGLFGWYKYLMNCPDRVHLALGSSLEHVLRTVLMSNGFGLYYLIPHGIFVRESINGAVRGVYKFLDNYGLEKQILFYGNEKENDKNKYQGFTIGSVYVNETLNQVVGGLLEANNRMASVRQPLMIMTQNPRGKAHPFYTKFESQRITSVRNIEKMEYVRDNYKEMFLAYEKQLLKDKDKEKRTIIKSYFNRYSVSNISDLQTDIQLEFNNTMVNINYHFDKIIRNQSVQDFAPYLVFSKEDYDNFKLEEAEIIKIIENNQEDETLEQAQDELYKLKNKLYDKYNNEYLLNKSMKKIVSFDRGLENPNKVINAYDFYYTHFTVDDNLSMTEMDKNDFKNTYAKGTSVFEQSVMGMRRSTDSAVYSMFTDENIMRGFEPNDFTELKLYQTMFGSEEVFRVIALDKGLNHPNGIVDVDIDFQNGIVYQLAESLLDVKKHDVANLGLETIYQDLLRIIRERWNRKMPIAILVDPSAIETYLYLQRMGLPVIKANNSVFKQRGEDNTEANQIQDKDLIGIPLVQTAIAKLKYRVHESCTYTIEQIGSYEAPFDENSGKDKVKKVNDDLVDPLRYIFNYYIRMSMWKGDGEEDVENKQLVRGNEIEENSQWDLARKAAEILNGESPGTQRVNTISNQDFFGGLNNFWGQ